MGRATLGAVVACAAQFMIGADGLSVAIALPTLRDDLGADAVDAHAVLVTVGTMLVLLGLTRVERGDPLLVAAPAAAGLATLAAFVAWERRTPEPLIRPGLFTTPSLRAATLGVASNAIAFTAIVYVGTLYLQDARGTAHWRRASRSPPSTPWRS